MISIDKTTKRTICQQCFGWKYVGSNHTEAMCQRKTTQVNNLMEQVEVEVLEQLAYKTISRKVDEKGEKVLKLQGIGGGQPLVLSVGQIPPPDPTPQLTEEELITMQLNAYLTDR